MAKYTSRYAELGFYVDGNLRQFTAGEFRTDSPDEIAVLDTLTDAICVDEPKPEEPAAKAPTTRKASAKASAE